MSAFALESKAKATAPLSSAPIAGVASGGPRRGASTPRGPTNDPEAARAVVMTIIRRIESYLDEETTALIDPLKFDFKASSDRKSQGLLDLNQALRRLQQTDVNADLQVRLGTFREKLAGNLRKIRLHLDAVKEIVSMLSDAIQNAESDGTYTRNIGPYRNAL
ncbi:MAG TPA: hypothetical protein VIF39_04770 [Hyphomicrobium sp.]